MCTNTCAHTTLDNLTGACLSGGLRDPMGVGPGRRMRHVCVAIGFGQESPAAGWTPSSALRAPKPMPNAPPPRQCVVTSRPYRSRGVEARARAPTLFVLAPGGGGGQRLGAHPVRLPLQLRELLRMRRSIDASKHMLFGSAAIFVHPRIVMAAAVEKPMMAESTKLPNACSPHSAEGYPKRPHELRSCPKVNPGCAAAAVDCRAASLSRPVKADAGAKTEL